MYVYVTQPSCRENLSILQPYPVENILKTVINIIKSLENVNFLGVEIHKCEKSGLWILKSLKIFGVGGFPPQIKLVFRKSK